MNQFVFYRHLALISLLATLSACTSAKWLDADFSEILPLSLGENPSPNGPLNSVAQVAQRAGIENCLSRVNQVANFLTRGSAQSRATLTLPPSDADQSLFSAAFEIKTSQIVSYASADFAPLDHACMATYEAVVYWPYVCKDVAKKNFSQFQSTGAIDSQIVTLQGSNSQLHIFLMPAGSGCVSIKKELVD